MKKNQKPKSHFLSIIVPAYRQARTIEKNLEDLLEAMEAIEYPFEIIVVVDGMVDRTFPIVKKANLPHVTCVAYRENQGKAYAIRFGMEQAKGDYILFIDSGFEIDPQGIEMLLMHMEWYEADVIVGSKRHQASVVNYTLIRKILSYGYYLLVRTLFNINVKDTQAGIKLFRKPVLEKILPRLVEKRFAGDLEMLVVAKNQGFDRIYEAPIKLNYDFSGVTSAATMTSVWRILIDTLAIFYRNSILNYYSKARNTFKEPDRVWNSNS